MTVIILTKPFCMKEFYKLNKDVWYMIDNKGKKIPNPPWYLYYCSKHLKTHEKDYANRKVKDEKTRH